MNQPWQPTRATFEELSNKAIEEMEEAERCAEKAKRRRNTLRSHVAVDQQAKYDAMRRGEVPDQVIESALDRRCGEDAYWKSKAGGNRWHVDQATMYGTLAMVAAEHDKRRARGFVEANSHFDS